MKRKTLLLIPLLLISALMLYTWTYIATDHITATWRHFAGLLCYGVVVIFFFRNTGLAALATGVFLLLASFNLLAITGPINTFWFRLGTFRTPPMQGISLGILALYVLLNYYTLLAVYLDYKEGRKIS